MRFVPIGKVWFGLCEEHFKETGISPYELDRVKDINQK